jgi:transposase InsO family protein
MAAKLAVSERLACKVLDQHRSMQRKSRSTADDEAARTTDLTELALQYGRYGYRRITALLRGQGRRCNHNQVKRIWRREDLPPPNLPGRPITGSGHEFSSPMEAKGIGELGICGVGAAVGNANYNATGVRGVTTRSLSTSCSTGCRTWHEV